MADKDKKDAPFKLYMVQGGGENCIGGNKVVRARNRREAVLKYIRTEENEIYFDQINVRLITEESHIVD